MAESCGGTLPRRRRREFAATVVAITCACVSQSSRDPRDTVDAAPSVLRDSAALPFDTVGARRTVPPNQFEYSLAGKWLAGDTTVWAHLMVYPFTRRGDDPAHIEVRAMGRDTSASELREIPVRFAKCPFELRLHTDARRERAPVWNSARAPRPTACRPRETNQPYALRVAVKWLARPRASSARGPSSPIPDRALSCSSTAPARCRSAFGVTRRGRARLRGGQRPGSPCVGKENNRRCTRARW